MRGVSTKALGLIVPSVAHPSFAAIIHGAEERAQESNYSLFISSIDRRWDRILEATKVMLDHRVDGIGYVYTIEEADHEAAQAARDAGAQVALVLPIGDRPFKGAVTLDNGAAMRQVASHLWNLGHRDYAIVMNPLSTANGRHRVEAITAALQDMGRGEQPNIRVVSPHVSSSMYEELNEIGMGQRAGFELWTASPSPTAVVAVTDTLAVGVVQAAHDLGIEIPRDASVVGFDDLPISLVCSPHLTTVAVPMREIGRSLVDLLIQEDGEEREGPVVIPTLIVRDSTGPAPGSKVVKE